MFLSHNSRTFLLICSFLVISLSFVACSKKDTGVFPQSITQTADNFLLPENLQQYNFEPHPRANIAPNPTGISLLTHSRMICYSSQEMPNIEYLFDGASQTTFLWRNRYPLVVEWPQQVTIDRLFLATSLSTCPLEIYYIDSSNNFTIPSFTKLDGPNIDISFTAPINTSKVYFLPFPGNNITFPVSEIEAYGPSYGSLHITSPVNNSIFSPDDVITFSGYGSEGDVLWTSSLDGAIGTNIASAVVQSLSIGTHTITLSLPGSIISKPTTLSIRSQAVGNISPDSITITIVENSIAKIKIRNLNPPDNEDPFAANTAVSYRAAKTQFQAIGYRADDTEIGPVSVRWELEGGDVDAHDQLKMGILSQLGQLNNKIGNLDNSLAVVASNSTVTFNSFLTGNIAIKASKGNLNDSVNVRIKQPHFKVNVYPVGDVDTSIFDIWKDIALQIWEKENIIKVDSVDLMPSIANVSYPDYPLTPPLSETEKILSDEYFINPSLTDPLVYDCFLGGTSGFFNVPKTAGVLTSSNVIDSINVYLTNRPVSFYISNSSYSPPKTSKYHPDIYSISSRDHFVLLENSSVIVRDYPNPWPTQYERFLATAIGRNFGLPQYESWLNNFMDFSPNGALDVTPLQYIAALNYNNDNPQNSVKIREE